MSRVLSLHTFCVWSTHTSNSKHTADYEILSGKFKHIRTECLQLTQIARDVTASHLRQRSHSTLDRINGLYANELNPSTLNDHYYVSNRSKFHGQYKAAYHRSQSSNTFISALIDYKSEVSSSPGFFPREVSEEEQDLSEVMRILTKLKVPNLAATDLSKLMPDDEMTPGVEIMAEVKAYFKGTCSSDSHMSSL